MTKGPRKRARTTIVHRGDDSRDDAREPLFNALAPFIKGQTGFSRFDDEQTWTLRDDPRIVATTAALADACGAVVVEGDDGWVAVEPFRPRWDAVPGACWLWSARRVGDAVVIRSVAACTMEALEREAGRFGWDVLTPKGGDPGAIVAIYLHPPAPEPKAETEAARRGLTKRDEDR